MEQHLEERDTKLERELEELNKELESRRILRKLWYYKKYPLSISLWKIQFFFKLKIYFVHVQMFFLVTISKSIQVQLKFKAKYTINYW